MTKKLRQSDRWKLTQGPNREYRTEGNEPILGEWKLVSRNEPMPTPDDSKVLIYDESLVFTKAKQGAVKAWIASIDQKAEAEAETDKVLVGIVEKANGLWESEGPFMINDLVGLSGPSGMKLRNKVATLLEGAGFKQKKIELFQPIIVWFKR